jgi:hypothetical protein
LFKSGNFEKLIWADKFNWNYWRSKPVKNLTLIIAVLLPCWVCSAVTDINIPNASFEDPYIEEGEYLDFAVPTDWFVLDYGMYYRIYGPRENFDAPDGRNVYYGNYYTHIATGTDEVIQADKLYTFKFAVKPLNASYLDFFYNFTLWAYDSNPQSASDRTEITTITKGMNFSENAFGYTEVSWNSADVDPSLVGKKLMISYQLERGWSDDFSGTVEDAPETFSIGPNPSFEYPEVPGDGSSSTYVELYGTGSDWRMYSDYGGLDRIYEGASAGTIDGDQCLYFNYRSHAGTVTDEVIEADKLYSVKWWLRPLTGDENRLNTWWIIRFWAYSDDNDPHGSKTKIGEIITNEYYSDFVWQLKEASLNTTGLDSQYIGQKLIVSYHLEQGWSDNFIGTVEEAPPYLNVSVDAPQSTLYLTECDDDTYEYDITIQTNQTIETDGIDVTVTPSNSQISVNGAPAGNSVTLNFTDAFTPQTVTLKAVNDSAEEYYTETTVTHTVGAYAGDPSYQHDSDITVRVVDNDGLVNNMKNPSFEDPVLSDGGEYYTDYPGGWGGSTDHLFYCYLVNPSEGTTPQPTDGNNMYYAEDNRFILNNRNIIKMEAGKRYSISADYYPLDPYDMQFQMNLRKWEPTDTSTTAISNASYIRNLTANEWSEGLDTGIFIGADEDPYGYYSYAGARLFGGFLAKSGYIDNFAYNIDVPYQQQYKLYLPTNNITLTATDDSSPTYQWSLVSGANPAVEAADFNDADVVFGSPDSRTTTVTFPEDTGDYMLRVTYNDGNDWDVGELIMVKVRASDFDGLEAHLTFEGSGTDPNTLNSTGGMNYESGVLFGEPNYGTDASDALAGTGALEVFNPNGVSRIDAVTYDSFVGSDPNITVSLWFNYSVDSIGDRGGFPISKFPEDGSGHGWFIRVYDDAETDGNGNALAGFIGSTWMDGAADLTGPEGTFAKGEWVHAVLTYNNGTASLYQDGILVAEQDNVEFEPGDWFEAVTIGRLIPWGDNGQFQGLIDEVQIYDYALTASEVQNLYTSYGGQTPSWVNDCYFDLDGDCSTVNMFDISVLNQGWQNTYDFNTLIKLSEEWLECTYYDLSQCPN